MDEIFIGISFFNIFKNFDISKVKIFYKYTNVD